VEQSQLLRNEAEGAAGPVGLLPNAWAQQAAEAGPTLSHATMKDGLRIQPHTMNEGAEMMKASPSLGLGSSRNTLAGRTKKGSVDFGGCKSTDGIGKTSTWGTPKGGRYQQYADEKWFGKGSILMKKGRAGVPPSALVASKHRCSDPAWTDQAPFTPASPSFSRSAGACRTKTCLITGWMRSSESAQLE